MSKLFTTIFKEGSIKSDIIKQLTNSEAEYLKLVKNSFLAAKVGIMNELYQMAQYKGVNYNKVKELLMLDYLIHMGYIQILTRSCYN